MNAGIRVKIVLPVVLIGLAAFTAVFAVGMFSMEQHKRAEVARATHLELIGHAIAVRTYHNQADRLVSRAVRGLNEQDRNESVIQLAIVVRNMHISLANFDYKNRTNDGAPDGLQQLETITETIDDWFESADLLVAGDIGPDSWRMLNFIERDAQLQYYLDRLVEQTHRAASEAATSDQTVFENQQRSTTMVLLVVVLLIGGVAIGLSNHIALALAKFTGAMHRLADGDLDVEISGDARRDEIGELARSLKVFRTAMNDVVATKLTMEQMALTDPLTGLPNRRGLVEFFNALLGQTGSKQQRLALMHVDLDHFKAVNDTIGHDAGDFVLREAAERMKSVLRKTDILARIGGDEFVALVPETDNEEALEAMCERIVRQFDKPFIFKDTPCHIGTSVGAARELVVPGKTSFDTLLQQADTALCAAKAGGRSMHLIFRDEMGARRDDEDNLASRIVQGLRDEEFEPWFQPMIDAKTGDITGLEVLSRWRHPERGILRPLDFLQVAEAHNTIASLGDQVLERALNDLQAWQMDGLEIPILHINISRAQILAPSAVDRLSWALDKAGFPPERTCIEIGETDCVGRGEEAVLANLRRLQNLGCGLLLDEFGAESGAIGNIIRLGASKVKTARDLVPKLLTEDEADHTRDLLEATIGASRSLGIRVVAKGVANPQQRSAAIALGFTEMQGDVIAPAMDAATTKIWLAQQTARADTPRAVGGI